MEAKEDILDLRAKGILKEGTLHLELMDSSAQKKLEASRKGAALGFFQQRRGEKVQVEIRLFGCLQAEVLVITHRFSAIYIWVITHFNGMIHG